MESSDEEIRLAQWIANLGQNGFSYDTALNISDPYGCLNDLPENLPEWKNNASPSSHIRVICYVCKGEDVQTCKVPDQQSYDKLKKKLTDASSAENLSISSLLFLAVNRDAWNKAKKSSGEIASTSNMRKLSFNSGDLHGSSSAAGTTSAADFTKILRIDTLQTRAVEHKLSKAFDEFRKISPGSIQVLWNSPAGKAYHKLPEQKPNLPSDISKDQQPSFMVALIFMRHRRGKSSNGAYRNVEDADVYTMAASFLSGATNAQATFSNVQIVAVNVNDFAKFLAEKKAKDPNFNL
ncbi:MAG: hypothetical protein ABW189_01295 [Rickettsiales bacterium]